MNDLDTLFKASTLDLRAIGAAFDAMDPSSRITAVRSLGKSAQQRLFAAADAGGGLDLEYMVPAARGELAEVIHYGKNSLPLFTHFQKRFARVPGRPDTLTGYNEQTMRPFTGPGYFEARVQGKEIAIDYTRVPREKCATWPEILPQTARLGRFVYAGMIDYLRRVSSHVTIGRAVRGGKETENYFLLCREG